MDPSFEASLQVLQSLAAALAGILVFLALMQLFAIRKLLQQLLDRQTISAVGAPSISDSVDPRSTLTFGGKY